jgi:hypothetical protein
MINSTNSISNKASGVAAKACGHARHVGPCPCCQRAQLARWTMQLTAASAPRRGRLVGGGSHA